MGRGIFAGVLLGGLASVLALGLASLIGEQPAGRAPPEAPQVTAPAEPAAAEEAAAPDAPAGATDAAPPADAAEAPPEPQTEPEAPVAETEPPPRPDSGSEEPVAPESPATPTSPAEGPGPSPDPAPDRSALATPEEPAARDGSPEAETEPASEPVETPEPAAPESPAQVTTAAPAPDAAEDPDPSREVAAAPEAPVSGEAVPTAETEPPARPAEAAQPAVPETPEAPDATDQAAAPEQTVTVPDPAAQPSAPVAEAVPSVSTESAAPPATEEEAPVSRFALSSETGNSLPGQPATTPGNGDGADAVTEAEAEEAPEAGALLRFGTAFEADGRPLLAVVLLDEGTLPGGAAALGGLPIPVTIVVDPARPDAAEAAARYRAAGLEVGLLSPVPRNATPQDVEVALEAARAQVSEAVVLVDAGSGGLAGHPQALEQALLALEEAGMGFVSVSSGLNASLRAAEAAGVPAAIFSRVLDESAGDAAAVRRALDQAAFRARQEGSAAVMARLTPDTLSALILWGTGAREGQVQPAPVSALLLEAAAE